METALSQAVRADAEPHGSAKSPSEVPQVISEPTSVTSPASKKRPAAEFPFYL